MVFVLRRRTAYGVWYGLVGSEMCIGARLVRCLYGTRDAPKRWEAFLAEQLVALGFARGRASPCCYFHAALGVRCIVHGDDFVLTGRPHPLDRSLIHI